MDLSIVGAGVAGLAAAHRLRSHRPDIHVTIHEKSRGVGGRLATRRFQGVPFDHGAQYIKTPTDPLLQFVTTTLVTDTLRNIPGEIWTFDAGGTIRPGDRQQNTEAKWTYTDGNTRFAKELARDLNIRFSDRIIRIEHSRNRWTLESETGLRYQADAVLLTPPSPQSAELVAASNIANKATITNLLDHVHYRPCLSLTFGYHQAPGNSPFYALLNIDKQHPISWVGLEHAKPERVPVGQSVYIVQMAPHWSRDHWDDPEDQLASSVTTLLSELFQQALDTPSWSHRQAWQFALPNDRADFEKLNQVVPGIFFAGDFTAGEGRVHRSVEQGWAIADLIAAALR